MDSFYIWHKWSLSLGGVSHITFFRIWKFEFLANFWNFSALTLKKTLQFSMDSFHIWYKWSLVWEGVLHIMTFDLDLYLQGHLAWPWKWCPLCSIYSSWWILSIFDTNDHLHEKVCCMWWPLTLTYIFKVIRPWLWKSCPLCSVYSSGWILSIFDTNDH